MGGNRWAVKRSAERHRTVAARWQAGTRDIADSGWGFQCFWRLRGRVNAPLSRNDDIAPIRHSLRVRSPMPEVVLIVDDDPVHRRLLESMVQRFGYQTAVAEGGDDAVKALMGSGRVDGVILDLVMPDLDGLGVLARMREAGLNIPVIVQTAHGGIDNVISAMRSG